MGMQLRLMQAGIRASQRVCFSPGTNCYATVGLLLQDWRLFLISWFLLQQMKAWEKAEISTVNSLSHMRQRKSMTIIQIARDGELNPNSSGHLKAHKQLVLAKEFVWFSLHLVFTSN